MGGAPGWYDDPDRVPGQQRWWDGQSWGELTRGGPAAVGTPSGRPGATTGGDVRAAHPGEDIIGTRDGAATRLTWVLIAAALAVVVVVALVVVGLGGRDTPPILGPGPTGPITAVPTPGPSDPGLPPGTVRIIDPDAGISYAYLGEGWREVDFEQRAEMRTVHGQYIVTQQTVPGGGEFIAEATSGLIAEPFGPTTPDGYAALAVPLVESFRANYYPGPNQQNVLTSQPVVVDGHEGYLTVVDLRWDITGYDSTGERAALLIMDTGKEVPALVFVSVPNTHAELYGIIDQLIASIQLL